MSGQFYQDCHYYLHKTACYITPSLSDVRTALKSLLERMFFYFISKDTLPIFSFRSYWVGSVSWSPGGLFLACVLKRGSLLMLARLGGLLTLTTSGCNVDFGPAHFLPLHPLVTYRYIVN